MKAKTIDQFTDAELAAMVRESIYAKDVRFGKGKTDARFLLVLAVAYGKDDGIDNLTDALHAFGRLQQDEDWKERSIQAYDHIGEACRQVTLEDCEAAEPPYEPTNIFSGETGKVIRAR